MLLVCQFFFERMPTFAAAAALFLAAAMVLLSPTFVVDLEFLDEEVALALATGGFFFVVFARDASAWDCIQVATGHGFFLLFFSRHFD